MSQYFFDTYALIEMLKGNPHYEPYRRARCATTRFHLTEFYYILLKDFGEGTAERSYAAFRPFVIDVEDEDIKNACRLRLKLRKRSVSYVDALGYTIAKRRGIPLLTGDKEFEGVQGVEFIR